jgi:hypothetical protein
MGVATPAASTMIAAHASRSSRAAHCGNRAVPDGPPRARPDGPSSGACAPADRARSDPRALGVGVDDRDPQAGHRGDPQAASTHAARERRCAAGLPSGSARASLDRSGGRDRGGDRDRRRAHDAGPGGDGGRDRDGCTHRAGGANLGGPDAMGAARARSPSTGPATCGARSAPTDAKGAGAAAASRGSPSRHRDGGGDHGIDAPGGRRHARPGGGGACGLATRAGNVLAAAGCEHELDHASGDRRAGKARRSTCGAGFGQRWRQARAMDEGVHHRRAGRLDGDRHGARFIVRTAPRSARAGGCRASRLRALRCCLECRRAPRGQAVSGWPAGWAARRPMESKLAGLWVSFRWSACGRRDVASAQRRGDARCVRSPPSRSRGIRVRK